MKTRSRPIEELPPPRRCAGACGVDEICSKVVYKTGCCLKPADRALYVKLTEGAK